MYFYLLLTVLTLLIVLAGLALWYKTKNYGFVVGMGALYFWSIYGAWAIVYDRLGGESGKRYHYLYDKLFPIYLDESYAWSLSLYALFILLVIFTVYILVGTQARLSTAIDQSRTPLVISHKLMLLVSFLSAFLSYMIVRTSLAEATSAGVSGYHMTRIYDDSISFFTLHQVLNRFALLPLTIGLAVLVSGSKARLIRAAPEPYVFPLYVAGLAVMYGFCMALGNKNELLFSLLCGALFYVSNSPAPRIILPVVIGVCALAAIAYIDLMRGIGLDSVWSEFSISEFTNALGRLTSSNESYGAHFSLYGSIEYEIPYTYGSSLLSFVCSLVPRYFWPNRPEEIYWHYHNYVGAVDGQGYSIHHATGWYLNFGLLGLVLGAVLLGAIWAKLYRNVSRAQFCRYRATRIFYTLAFFAFSAGIPNLVRAGPQAYKGMLIDAFIVPVMIVWISSHSLGHVKRHSSVLHVNRARQTV